MPLRLWVIMTISYDEGLPLLIDFILVIRVTVMLLTPFTELLLTRVVSYPYIMLRILGSS